MFSTISSTAVSHMFSKVSSTPVLYMFSRVSSTAHSALEHAVLYRHVQWVTVAVKYLTTDTVGYCSC